MAEGTSTSSTLRLSVVFALFLGSLDLAASISLPYPLVTSFYRLNPVGFHMPDVQPIKQEILSLSIQSKQTLKIQWPIGEEQHISFHQPEN